MQKRWDFLRKAIRRMLVHDLPGGTEVGVVLFRTVAKEILPLRPTPQERQDRTRLATNSLPRYPSSESQGLKCIKCGLQKAIQVI